jgi:ferredoxin-nitrite reductase
VDIFYTIYCNNNYTIYDKIILEGYYMTKLEEAYASRNKKINKIEKLKELKTPMSVYERLQDISCGTLEDLADEDSGFFLKCFGLFLKKDRKFMLRIRIPAGQLTPVQAMKIGEIAKNYGDDYIDITTRQQIELRYLELQNLATILEELDSVGITTFQTGVDNFRNIVTSSFDGLGDKSILEVKPIIDELQSIFLKKEEWIGQLPRKFNTAILGANVNDCNIYGHDCCFVIAKKGEKIGFNLYLGGKVGVQASDTGLFLTPDEVVPTFKAVVELFKQYGFRDNRNKNRLHFLLEAVGMDEFIKAIKETSSLEYEDSGEILASNEYILNESGVFDLSDNLSAVHLSIPSGVFKGTDLNAIGAVAFNEEGMVRLSVEQSLYVVVSNDKVKSVKESEIFESYDSYQNIYFNHQIACAGTATCAFGVIPNKPDAIEMANFLAKEVPIKDGKVRMYWSACPKGCGIHGVADIGFEGCIAKDEEGNKVNGVHILLGGKATKEVEEARVIAKSVPLTKAKYIVKDLMEKYRDEKLDGESFEAYDSRVLSKLTVEEIL